jgi:hypothetical protein
MLFLISGAAASGKKTVAQAVAERLPKLEAHHDSERPARVGDERLSQLELWIDDALRLEGEGIDLVLASQSPLGEVLASPRAIELEGIAACLLDCHDFVRLERWVRRGIHPDWPVGQDHFFWAVFHRMHARDPQWEQRVLLDRNSEASVWSRWTGWQRGDARWNVFIHDSSDEDPEATTRIVSEWIRSVRESGQPLARRNEWWKA